MKAKQSLRPVHEIQAYISDLDELHRKIEVARRARHWLAMHKLHQLAADSSKLIYEATKP